MSTRAYPTPPQRAQLDARQRVRRGLTVLCPVHVNARPGQVDAVPLEIAAHFTAADVSPPRAFRVDFQNDARFGRAGIEFLSGRAGPRRSRVLAGAIDLSIANDAGISEAARFFGVTVRRSMGRRIRLRSDCG
jgi:hypothetical protein